MIIRYEVRTVEGVTFTSAATTIPVKTLRAAINRLSRLTYGAGYIPQSIEVTDITREYSRDHGTDPDPYLYSHA